MNLTNWIALMSGIVLQVAGLIIVLWQWTIKSNRTLAERDATWQARLDGHDEKFKATEKAMEEINENLERLEDQFNHRFTDYKNEVIALITEIKSDREKAFNKFDSQFTCLSKKLNTISLDMAFLKGERHKEGRSKFPSQHPETDE